ncbi:MAG: hypothetical protein AAGA75_15865 [Cyanobacteria bacterium P01_E01_bin.6]
MFRSNAHAELTFIAHESMDKMRSPSGIGRSPQIATIVAMDTEQVADANALIQTLRSVSRCSIHPFM